MKGQDPFQHQFQHAKWVCLNMGTPNSNALSLLFSYSIADLLVFRVGAPISDTHKNHIKLVLYIYIYIYPMIFPLYRQDPVIPP